MSLGEIQHFQTHLQMWHDIKQRQDFVSITPMCCTKSVINLDWKGPLESPGPTSNLKQDQLYHIVQGNYKGAFQTKEESA